MSAEADPLLRRLGPLSRDEATFLALMRAADPALRQAVLAYALGARLDGHPPGPALQ